MIGFKLLEETLVSSDKEVELDMADEGLNMAINEENRSNLLV